MVSVAGYTMKGNPMPGVTVKTKDDRQITFTDKDGIFFIKGVDGRAVLVVSAVGYLTKEINANDEVVLDIRMVVSNTKLDEVQVIAYGETTKRLNTDSVNKRYLLKKLHNSQLPTPYWPCRVGCRV